MAVPIPENEELRLKELYALGILDTEREEAFDHLVELASFICKCDMSLITLVDRDRQWFKAKKGFEPNETPKKESMCAYAILQDDVFIVQNALEDDRFSQFEAVRTDPHIRFYAGAPIISTNGYNLGTVCVFDDHPKNLTPEQKKALQFLSTQAAILIDYRRKNERLEEAVRAEQRLKAEAEKATRAQEQFLSAMSHEIRTPLNGVVGMTDLLLRDAPQPHQIENLESLRFASENLLHVVNDILDYNKITSGHIVFEQKPFSIAQLLHQLKKPYLLKASAKNISLSFEVDPLIPDFIIGDAGRLTQILHNLVGNAVKFTSQGGVVLNVKPVHLSHDYVELHFEVTDTGIGIPQDKLPNIFKQFTQAHAGIAREYGGTGLGLSITQHLLQLQGSGVDVRSTCGKGSTFSFSLRFGIAKPGDVPEPIKTPESRRALEGIRVLVVDDNKMNRMLLRKMLGSWKIEVGEAENGKLAIEELSVNSYDLVFMDMQMPEMDGATATQHLRNGAIFSGPIIALTADAFVNRNNDIASLGFNDYLIKPFRAEELQAKIALHVPNC